MSYELIIIGGGPAGAGSAVYAARKRLKTALITEEFGGQSTVSPDIQNWIGTVSVSGNDLAQMLKDHVEAYAADVLDIKKGLRVEKVEKEGELFKVTNNDGSILEAQTVLICAGAHRRKLTIPGADEFENKGITYCASCDGPMFSGQKVAVIGGGNAGFETAAQLLNYTDGVTLLQRSDQFKADPITVEKVLQHPNMTAIKNAETLEIKGDKFVQEIVYRDANTEEVKTLPVTGVFVEIGLVPNTDLVADLVELTEYKQVKVNPKNQRTSIEGVWAAGDCTDGLYHQNNIACGDAVKALEDIYLHIKTTS